MTDKDAPAPWPADDKVMNPRRQLRAAVPGPGEEEFVRCNELWISTIDPEADGTVFVNTYTGVGPPDATWTVIDLKPRVPADAKACFLSGILIISQGSYADGPPIETADLQVCFRKLGSTDEGMIGQAVIARWGGVRTNMATWVPLLDGKLEFAYWRSTHQQYPQQASYGINLQLQAWVR